MKLASVPNQLAGLFSEIHGTQHVVPPHIEKVIRRRKKGGKKEKEATNPYAMHRRTCRITRPESDIFFTPCSVDQWRVTASECHATKARAQISEN